MTVSAKYRFMQYNVMHHAWGNETLLAVGLEKRTENMVKIITDVAPDVLFLAERHEEYANVGDDSVDMNAALGSNYVFVQDRIENGTVVIRVPSVYNALTFRCVESGYIKLTEECSFEQSGNKRVVTWAILEDITETESKGQRIAVFCTHWSTNVQWNDPTISYAAYKQQQSNEMQALINSEKFEGLPVIAGGDYNATYNSIKKHECYVSLLEGAGLVDASASLATEENSYVYGDVDHFAVSGCTVESFTILWNTTDYASDHNPIYSDMKFEFNKIGG